jgi:hypothetical protein
MKNFLSPLCIRTNTISGERICIGLFVAAEDRFYFAWSESKLRVAARLVAEDIYPVLSKSFLTMEQELAASDGNKLNHASGYTYNYFAYLEAYNNGLLEFRKPSILPKAITSIQFQSLYKLYVGEALVSKESLKKHVTLHQKIKHHLKAPVFVDKTDLNYKVSETLIKTIYRPQQVDFISCNGSLLTGSSIDFTASPDTIKNKLYEFRALVDGLMDFAEHRHLDGPGKYIAYYEPPQKEAQYDMLQHALYDQSKNFDLQPIEKLADAASLLEKHNYRKFSDLIANHIPLELSA